MSLHSNPAPRALWWVRLRDMVRRDRTHRMGGWQDPGTITTRSLLAESDAYGAQHAWRLNPRKKTS